MTKIVEVGIQKNRDKKGGKTILFIRPRISGKDFDDLMERDGNRERLNEAKARVAETGKYELLTFKMEGNPDEKEKV